MTEPLIGEVVLQFLQDHLPSTLAVIVTCLLAWCYQVMIGVRAGTRAADQTLSAAQQAVPEPAKLLVRALVLQGLSVAGGLELATRLQAAGVSGVGGVDLVTAASTTLPVYYAAANYLAVTSGELPPTMLSTLGAVAAFAAGVAGYYQCLSPDTLLPPAAIPWLVAALVWGSITVQATPALAIARRPIRHH